MVPQMHVSGLMMLSKCGEMFRRRYVEGERDRPSISMIVGSGVDSAVSTDMVSKAAHGLLLDDEAITDIARDSVHYSMEEPEAIIDGDDDDPERPFEDRRGDAIDKAVRLSLLHHREAAPKLSPRSAAHVQRKFALQIPGLSFDLAGTIDLHEERGIRDTKTSKKTPPADEADTSLQLTAYAMAAYALDGEHEQSLALDFLVDKKEPAYVERTTTRTPDDFDPLYQRLEAAETALRKGVFVPANPSDWWCSAKYCQFHHNCRYVRRPKTVALSVNGKEVTV